jgi:hypothetical protein
MALLIDQGQKSLIELDQTQPIAAAPAAIRSLNAHSA